MPDNGRPDTKLDWVRARQTDDALMDALRVFLRRYVVMTDAQLLVVALWVIHTHVIDEVEQTPYLAVTSPERQCGKSRLLETIELLVARPWMAVLPSEAVVYRRVDQYKPTLLLDEVDAVFNPKSADRYEGLRALLNAGHRRGATVPRCIGKGQDIIEFSTFCAKVIAGIGTLPDTVADRSIPIRLERRKRGERVARFLRREVKEPAAALFEQIAHWGELHAKKLGAARPDMPEELSDRMQEGCECLVAIADLLGVGPTAREALVEVLGAERLDDQETMRLRLLRDARVIWRGLEAKKGKPVRAIRTERLLKELCALDEAPWGSYYGHALEPRDLAALLRHFGIHSTTVRYGRAKKQVAKGYRRDALWDAWERYL